MTSNTLSNVADIREQLQLLRLERATVSTAELPELDDEIEAAMRAYVGAAVTEIASLRADLSGQLRG